MTYDPYQDAGLRRDLPRNEPLQAYRDENRAALWVPLALVALIIIGLGYMLLGSTSSTTTNVRADSGAVTKPEPSPNKVFNSPVRLEEPRVQARGSFFPARLTASSTVSLELSNGSRVVARMDPETKHALDQIEL